METLSETCADPLQTSHIENIVCNLIAGGNLAPAIWPSIKG
jgi:hypothetical protein